MKIDDDVKVCLDNLQQVLQSKGLAALKRGGPLLVECLVAHLDNRSLSYGIEEAVEAVERYVDRL